MPTLTQIEPCDPPTSVRDQATGPSTPLDHQILQHMQDREPMPLRAITRAVGSTTHRVHARLQVLIDRGLIRREALPDGPKRGPGASVYSLTAQVWD